MTRPVRFESRAGPDGILSLRVPLGPEGADARVRVTVEPLPGDNPTPDDAEWHRFVDATYGSCEGLGLERQPQGDFEEREELE